MSPTIGPKPPASDRGGREKAGIERMSRSGWYALLNSAVVAWLLAAVVVLLVQQGIPAFEWLAVHLTLLGAASTAILIWSQHFADTLVRRAAAGARRALGLRLLVHTAGAVAVVLGVTLGVWGVVLTGAVLVAAAATAHSVSLARQLRLALPARFAPLVRYYIIAGLFLVIGVTFGVLLARADVTGAARDRLYVAHIVFNLAGWVGLTVVGTVILLWPTLLHARILPTADAAARRALPLLAAGVLVVGAACLVGVRVGVSLGLAVYLSGFVLIAIEGVRQARQARPAGYAAWSMAAALAWFAGCVVTLGVLATTAGDWAGISSGVNALLLPVAAGFVAQLVIAALSYLLPVVLGGGPARARRMSLELDRFAVFRVIVVNGALALAVLPVPDAVRMLAVVSALVVLAGFLPLAIRGLVLARRARPEDWTVKDAPRASATLHARSGGMMAAVGVLVLVAALGVALGGGPAAPGTGASTGAGTVAATGRTTTVQLTMRNMRFSPSTVEVPAGNRLVIRVTNADPEVHDLTLATGESSGRLIGGASATVDVGVVSADIDGWCSITGHRQLGMVMTVVAVGGATASGGGAGGAGGAGTADMGGMHMGGATSGSAATGAGASAAQDIDLAKRPAASFTPYDATLAPVGTPAGTVHRLTLTVRNTLTQVAPGVWQTLWTYNGTAPGPMLRGNVGDTFVITLVNDAKMGHSIDFHAGSLAPNVPMRTIQPGQRLTYTFTATRSGIWMYHCSTMPMSAHIANGMFGAVVIDPPRLDPVGAEFAFVQSEYYLGPQKGEVDAAKVATQRPDLVVFNGYANQYVYRPISVKAGQRVRIWVLDAGPNVASSFHVVGGQFDTVFKEGDYLLHNGGSTGTGGAQAIDLQPAEGGFVELTFPEPGDYTFVTHIMSDAEIGARGTIHVTK